jgi:RimJ/RimL family protein N-acetyltransferase
VSRPAVLTTERLELRPSGAADLEILHALWTEPRVRRFLFDGRSIDAEEARRLVERGAATFESEGWGVWLVRERCSGAALGFVGLMRPENAADAPTLPEDPPRFVVGMTEARCGEGLALEASERVLRHAFGDLGVEAIRADVDAPNAASIRLLNRLGFRFEARRRAKARLLREYRLRHSGLSPDGPSSARLR